MSVSVSHDQVDRAPTVWTRRLQLLTGWCSVVFTIGTLLNLVVMSPQVIERSMRLSGLSAAEAADGSESFYLGFLAVGLVYVIGNALGILALKGWNWVFWVAIAVNLTQGMGLVGAIPPEVFDAALDIHGPVGMLPTVIVDGGALILAAILIVSIAKFRTPWARHRSPGYGSR